MQCKVIEQQVTIDVGLLENLQKQELLGYTVEQTKSFGFYGALLTQVIGHTG